MADFMYLYWNNKGKSPMDNASPEETQKRMQKWMAWMESLKKAGHLKDGGVPLETTGKVVHGGKRRVTDVPNAETKDVLIGYTIVSAKSLDEAVDLTKGLPILESEDGLVEVRPVRAM